MNTNLENQYQGPYTTQEFETVIRRKSQTLRVWAMNETLPAGVRVVRARRKSPLLWFVNWSEFMATAEAH